MPSPSTTLLKTLLAVSRHDNDAKLGKRVNDLIEMDTKGLTASPLWNATHIDLISSMLVNNEKMTGEKVK